ncbi:hypothetical protein [Candidatus Roseilinea sp. NK_OTU-006]|jgi:hypothetical protein|uniref:hypothetical protein n=1 Tax=Candidatus Roseilinea sp. NK_OTU-006 TaxID=2704250 RepID=UPI00145DF48B|nr:hypothetical protein [Candidatus Roseilinea sp. NK_OTU-006]
MNKTLIWRAYLIEKDEDLASAVSRYQQVTGKRPKLALASEKADAALLEKLKAAGLTVQQSKTILPRDVWLTHEAAVQTGLL